MSSEAMKAFDSAAASGSLKPLGTELYSTLRELSWGANSGSFIYTSGNALLAQRLGVSARAVSSRLQKLEAAGFIRTVSAATAQKRNKVIRVTIPSPNGGSPLLPSGEQTEAPTVEAQRIDGGSPAHLTVEAHFSLTRARNKQEELSELQAILTAMTKPHPGLSKVTLTNPLREALDQLRAAGATLDTLKAWSLGQDFKASPAKFAALLRELAASPPNRAINPPFEACGRDFANGSRCNGGNLDYPSEPQRPSELCECKKAYKAHFRSR